MIYLIAVGGTGIRVMRSFLQMCMAGCFCGESFKVICVDSDSSNGDMDVYKKLAQDYSKLMDSFHSDDFAKVSFHENNKAKSDPDKRTYGIWSPLNATTNTLAEILKKGKMQDAEEVFDFFYTEAEQKQELNGGFYGHTSIGTLLMADAILDGGGYNSEWLNFFDLAGKSVKDDTDRVFIIGSVFGGTGASGIPAIANIIRSTESTKNMKLGSVFVMPYFDPGSSNDEKSGTIAHINGEIFDSKLRSAMMFYKDQIFVDQSIFDVVYMIGTNDEMIVPNATSGPEQRNKASYTELLAAASVIDFMGFNDDEFKVRFFNEELSDIERLEIKNTDDKTVYDKLAEFLVFSVMYTKYFNKVFEDKYKVPGEWQNNLHKTVKYDKKSQVFAHEREAMLKCTEDYMAWVYEICMSTKETPGADRGIFVKNDADYSVKRDFSESRDNIFKAQSKTISDLYSPSVSIHEGVSGILKTSRYSLSSLEAIADLLVEEKLPPNHLKLNNGLKIVDILSNEGFNDYKSDFAVITLMNAVKDAVWYR